MTAIKASNALRQEQALAWLRERPQGATARALAALSGLGIRHQQKVCSDLALAGLVVGEERTTTHIRSDGQRVGARTMVYRLAEAEGTPPKRPVGVDRGRKVKPPDPTPIARARTEAEPPKLDDITPDEREGPQPPTERELIVGEAWNLLEHSSLLAAVTGRSTWTTEEAELVLLRAGLRSLKGAP